MVRERVDGVVVAAGNLNFDWKRIVDLAARHRLPAIYISREVPEAGGLVSEGAIAPGSTGAPPCSWTSF